MSKENFENSMAKIRNVIHGVIICLTATECIESLKILDDNKAFVKSSDI